MDRRMLINATDPEECRIAIVEDGNIVELEVESNVGGKLKGNIYKAKISRIEPSLQAAFIDIGTQRNGFLQINDIHPAYFKTGRHSDRNPGRARIQDVLEAGQELVVQVVKEEREAKGATLTTYLSLPGRYLVVMPGSDRGGISRKISDSDQRSRLRKLTQELEVPAGIGMIIRTAGLDRSQSELSRDLSLQLKLWEKIVTASQSAVCPQLLYKESDLATRVIRDYFTPEIREILIDEPDTFNRVKEFVGEVMPRYRSRVRLYEEKQPMFSSFGVEEQVEETLRREVKLPSGGAIVIDSLEALVAIDVNSGKATAGENIEDTAYRTNLEAADVIAQQLRLRDLGGLIVVDFIDMLDKRHRAAVERRLADALKTDKARVEIGHLSQFGLLEMSRQRLRASLSSQSHVACPHCRGLGKLKNTEIVALEVLRKIQNAVIVGHVSSVKARLSPAPALFLLNHKKQELARLEEQSGGKILILADGRLRSDEYEFEMDSTRVGTASIEQARTAPAAASAAKEKDEQDREPQRLIDEDEEESVAQAARRRAQAQGATSEPEAEDGGSPKAAADSTDE
ncbi:MAG: Rne/Rng family ribonuclease [Oligoflexia bacterium]|nr:Rne/Rng family ribonuclease [Oligoflexia bacterium]